MLPSKHVLIIDDNVDICELLRAILERTYKVTSVNNGQTGIASALRDLPDIILCDLVMPGMGGIEVIATLRSETATAKTPVIVMSGRGEAMDMPQTNNPIVFLQKPFQPGEVHTIIAEALTAE